MAEQTEIVFVGGGSLTVGGPIESVVNNLGEAMRGAKSGLNKLSGPDGGDVFVNQAHVAYVQERKGGAQPLTD